MRKSLKAKVRRSRVFSEDHEKVKKKIIWDPQGQTIHRWSQIFLIVSIFSLFLDPVFFFLPGARVEACIEISIPLQITLTVLRSVADVFYIIQIIIQFRTAYVEPSSRVLGRGELVINPSKIALRYLRRGFFFDLVAALPLPQVLIWAVIPNLTSMSMIYTKHILRFIVLFQYIPRLILVYPLSAQVTKATGIVTQTPLAGAAYNFMLFMLSSHILGAGWYLLAINRQEVCWLRACALEKPTCEDSFFDCHSADNPIRDNWFQSTNVTNLCGPTSAFFQFGMYAEALSNNVTGPKFLNKILYSFWWGLKNLSTFAQNLLPSVNIVEGLYTILLGTLGLILLSLLIGNMLRYLQSTDVRLEEWRIKRNDAEQWMHHRHLPPDQRQSVRKYDQYKWVATQGVDEAAILNDLPMDLRRAVNRHLCHDLVRGVPLFDQMDEPTLDAICERLKPALCPKSTFQVREGDPVNEMLFIIRGHLDSYTTNGGRAGFFNSCLIGPGDFCGEELLTWALDPCSSFILPSSTRTVKAISEVEAFALTAEDLKFVAAQFRRLHSKQIRHKFRFHSHQWRTWAACYIQAGWRRYKKHKEEAELEARENAMAAAAEPEVPSPGSGSAVGSARLSTSSRWSMSKRSGSESGIVISMQKPEEPDFSAYEL